MRIAATTVLLLSVFGVCATACSSESGAEQQVAAGTASLPLTATGDSGALYRLTSATFDVIGPTSGTLSTDDLPDSATIDVQLDAGAYQILLQPSWVMERELDGVTGPVEAALLSANPAEFAIVDQTITEVNFVFQVGDDVVQLGEGVLRLGIEVQETGAACTSDTDCPVGQICDANQCVVEAPVCATDADCGAGEWCFVSTSFGNACVPTGAGTTGEPCDGSSAFSCDPQFLCLDIGAGPICNPMCTVVLDDCPAGLACTPLATEPGEAADIGICI